MSLWAGSIRVFNAVAWPLEGMLLIFELVVRVGQADAGTDSGRDLDTVPERTARHSSCPDKSILGEWRS